MKNITTAVSVGGLLHTFNHKGEVNITYVGSIQELDDVTESGIYTVVPTSGAYGTLVVYNSFGGSGGVVQRYYHVTGINITRIKTSNSENTWTEI